MSTTIERDLEADDTAHPAPDGRRRRTRALWLTLAIAVPAGAGTAYWLLAEDSSAEAASDTTGPATTAVVTRETLAATADFGGTLGHGDAYTITAAGQGTITRVAGQDSDLERGSELYRLNEQPVTLMYGPIPMYRELALGASGVDVEQLEENLRELGYDGFEVDGEYDSLTEAAVQEWQDDSGAAVTGTVRPADVVFMPEGGRVDGLHVDIGSTVAPGASVLDITGSDQVVSLEVGVTDRDLFEVDSTVTVELPDGSSVAGTVTDVSVTGGAPQSTATGGEEAAGADDAVAGVEVDLNENVDRALLGSSVDVVVNIAEEEDILVVPVNALLARADGGYGLEVVHPDGTAEIVPVEVGLFAESKVEVSGQGIDEGTEVGVAGR